MQKTKGCNSCKKKGLNKKEWFLVSCGIVILVSSAYGIIHFFKHLLN